MHLGHCYSLLSADRGSRNLSSMIYKLVRWVPSSLCQAEGAWLKMTKGEAEGTHDPGPRPSARNDRWLRRPRIRASPKTLPRAPLCPWCSAYGLLNSSLDECRFWKRLCCFIRIEIFIYSSSTLNLYHGRRRKREAPSVSSFHLFTFHLLARDRHPCHLQRQALHCPGVWRKDAAKMSVPEPSLIFPN